MPVTGIKIIDFDILQSISDITIDYLAKSQFICYMAKEDKYRIAKSLILSGNIKTVRDLLGIVDKTPLSKDVGTTAIRFNGLIDNPENFTFHDCIAIAEVLQVDPKLIVDMVYREMLSKKKRRNK